MDLRELNYFISVYECGSISAAAKASYISQPSISAALQQLEHKLGQALFNRHPKGVIATEAGERLYPLAKQLIGQAHAIENSFKQKRRATPFRLGLVEALGAERMTKVIKKFTEAVEGLELTLVEPDQKADARIISDNMRKPNEAFISMWVDEFQMAMPLDHPLALKEKLSLADLDGLSFIYRSPSLVTKNLTQAMRPHGYSFNVCARIRTLEYAIGLVEAGVGCALIPTDPSFYHPDQLVLKPIEGLFLSREVGVAYDEHLVQTPCLDALIEACG